MRVELRNIGIIKQADIELEGLTVITGYNDSGKSTVGKALYSLYHGMNFYQENIMGDSLAYAVSVFRKLFRENLNRDNIFLNHKIERSVEHYFKVNEMEIKLFNVDFADLLAQIEDAVKTAKLINDAELEQVMCEFQNRLEEIESLEFRQRVKSNTINRIFNQEFAGKINCVLDKEAGSIKISDNDISYLAEVSNNEVKNLEQNIPETLNFDDVIFIDTPMILDDLDELSLRIANNSTGENHKRELSHKLLVEATKRKNIIEDAILAEKKSKIIKKISEVLHGQVESERGRLFHQINGNSFDVSTLASGLKTYVIIRRLIDNGYLTDKSLLIIDEPEVHLHPQWQLHFAEVLVLLLKNLDIKMILTTHSPYFLQALELFSKKYKLGSRTHFYLAKCTSEGAVFKNIDKNIDETVRVKPGTENESCGRAALF